jgi:hypothetical protein
MADLPFILEDFPAFVDKKSSLLPDPVAKQEYHPNPTPNAVMSSLSSVNSLFRLDGKVALVTGGKSPAYQLPQTLD